MNLLKKQQSAHGIETMVIKIYSENILLLHSS